MYKRLRHFNNYSSSVLDIFSIAAAVPGMSSSVSSLIQLTGSENPVVLSKEINSSPSDSSTAVAATVCQLQRLSDKRCQFAAPRLLFLPPLDQNVSLPSGALQDYFHKLASSAQAAATFLACSSILAGQGSESDDFGDTSVWLGEGDFGEGHETSILSKLGMEKLFKDCRISSVELRPPYMLPSTVEVTSTGPEIDQFAVLLAPLKEKYCFVTNPATGGIVVYFLVGRISRGVESGWGGLVGVATWSDA